ncbi:chitin synthase chs-2-like [Mya arenaria]|uniref:chitin synthase chs-2-like n=1 Tax=Mya arenaria TaxID=6604 RepID=UPI0022E7C411|nr:chitin synthase chs-2-like [Mya arenaria]
MKDNKKVKNKKRWSQVMYMSYVLEFRQKGKLNNCYILATDADVDFTPESVDSLLDMMKRDENVGAVCARTHPLGSGPIVWYQIFEYAIGHWLQKTAEHVIGTVLCAPGCFSLYRCTALEQVLDKYKGKVGNAFDFLTMDMGEDRWLCTLMVQSGRRIDYCAKADCKTYCPDTFEEFFKQRRRWILSTLANHILLLKE